MTNQVAHTILAQLGGSKFVAMTGAHSLTSGPTALSMRIGRNAKRVSAIRVELRADDTYTMIGFRSRPFPVCVEETFRLDGLYCDMLADAFESKTGLATSL